MDFSFSDEQQALRELARTIFADRLTHERLKQIAADPDWFARDVWAELAKADFLGIALPEEYGGGGLSMIGSACCRGMVAPQRRCRCGQPVPALCRFSNSVPRRSQHSFGVIRRHDLSAALVERLGTSRQSALAPPRTGRYGASTA
jgi:hypothetical protein